MPANPYLSERSSSTTEDPLLGFNFMLELEGQAAGYFTECSGIGSEHEVVEHKVVDNQGHEITRKLPGRLTWGDVTLKRGITSDMAIWEWRDTVVKGSVADARTNISVTMLDREYSPVAVWNFANAWPSKVDGPSFNTEGSEIGVEEMTMVHEGMYREL